MRILDTSVAVDHLRGAAPAVALLRNLVSEDEPLVASEMTRFELLAGVRDSEMSALAEFFSALAWVPVESEVTRVGGELARRYRQSHDGIDAPDYLIAATALVLDAPLLTTNVRHFPMFEGLTAPY